MTEHSEVELTQMNTRVREMPPTGSHLIHFYEGGPALAQTVGQFLAEAITRGGTAIAVADSAHRLAFEAELAAAGIDPGRAAGNGSLICIDAAETLGRFVPDGRIDSEAFRLAVAHPIADAASRGGPVHVYGEMVGLLWNEGNVIATIELEKLWNDLGKELVFTLLCGYPVQSPSDPADVRALEQICQLHSAVLDAPPSDRQPDPRTGISRRFDLDLHSPREARRFIAATLREWGHDGLLIDDAQLVVSELATNAVIHAQTPFSVVASLSESGVRVAVIDECPVQPHLRFSGFEAQSGRGLHVVAALTRDWGVESTNGGKTVWAEFSLSGLSS